jgi:hypothetical protein
MAPRRKQISFFNAVLGLAVGGLLLLAGPVSSLEIHELHDEAEHLEEPRDHDEKSTHVHTHRHKDGTKHSHTHYHGHCGGKLTGYPMNCFHLNNSLMPAATWLFYSVVLIDFDPILESHVSGLFRPPILA